MIYQLTSRQNVLLKSLNAGWEFVIRDINDCRKTPWLELCYFFRSRYCTFRLPLKDAPKFGSMFFNPQDFILEAHGQKKHKQQIYHDSRVFRIKPPFVGLRRFCFFGFHSVRKERAVVHDIARKHGFDSSEAEGRLTAETPAKRWVCSTNMIYHKTGAGWLNYPSTLFWRDPTMICFKILNDFTVDSALVYGGWLCHYDYYDSCTSDAARCCWLCKISGKQFHNPN